MGNNPKCPELVVIYMQWLLLRASCLLDVLACEGLTVYYIQIASTKLLYSTYMEELDNVDLANTKQCRSIVE